MKWLEAKVIFEADNIEAAGELIATVFYDMGVKGVVLEGAAEEPVEGWGDDAVQIPDHNAVTGFFPKNDLTEQQCLLLEQGLTILKTKTDIEFIISYRDIDEEDWAESWKAYFWPEKITETITVKPTWREYSPDKHEMIIELDPGMAFGTGTHPTTAMCISLIEAYINPGYHLLDIGTGSGILMIAAAMLGAEQLLGIDIDNTAVDIARNNLELNRVDTARYHVSAGDLSTVPDKKFDMIVANILSEVIIEMLDDIKNRLADSGVIILSGITEKNKTAVTDNMQAAGIDVIEICTKEEWVAIAGKKTLP